MTVYFVWWYNFIVNEYVNKGLLRFGNGSRHAINIDSYQVCRIRRPANNPMIFETSLLREVLLCHFIADGFKKIYYIIQQGCNTRNSNVILYI